MAFRPVVVSKDSLQEQQRQVTRSALLLAVARHILEAREAGGRLAEEVFGMIREQLDAEILIAHRAEPDGTLRLVGHAGIPRKLHDAATRRRFAQILCSRVAGSREPLVVEDAHAECIANEPAACFLRELGMRAYACHPLLGREGAVLGTLAVARTNLSGFRPEEVEFMQTVSHFLALAWDRQRTEEALGASEAQHRALLRSITDGFLAVDREWRLTYVNREAEALTGRERAELLGRCLWDEFADLKGTEFEHAARRALAENVTVTVEALHPRRQRWYAVHAYPSPEGLSLYFSDVTDARQAQRVLQETRERLQLAQQAGRIGSFEWNLRSDAVLWSPELEALYGLRPGTFDGTYAAFLSAVHPADRARVDEEVRAALSGGGLESEWRIVWPDGAVHWLAARARVDRDEAGRPVRLLGVNIDITAGKRVEEERLRREQEFDTLANHMSQLAWMADRDGWIYWYNRRWFDYTGTTLDEMKGWGWRKVHHPAHEARVVEKLRRCFETGEPWEDTFPLRGRDGGWRWFLSRAVPIRDESGAVLRWLGTNTDVTEQRAGEARLRQRERELATLVDNDPNILTRHDRQMRYVLVNAKFETVTGLAREQALGREVCEHGILAPACEAWQEAIRQVLAQGRPRDVEFELDTPEGRRYFESRVVPEFSPEGGVEYALSVVQDRTPEKLAQETLREAASRKDEFLATLAHELRNPLAPLRTGLEILRLSPAPGPAAEKALGTMERQLTHMVRLIDDLLDVSRISRGKLELRRERLTLRPVLDNAIEASRPAIDAGRHDLRLHLPHEPLYLEADAIRLAQVVSNLLNNAAKYTPEGGRIDLSAEREGPEAVIRVEDNGVGIPREMLPEVFEMFTQVGRTLDRAQGGLGIGLSIVRRLVEMHGGTIEADSAGPGRGAVFTVRLPLAPDPDRQVGAPPAAADAPRMRARRVLVVDDNPDAADTLAMMLGLLGQDTRTAYGGAEALEAAAGFRPEIVFCDIGMPGMNGYEVARRLRRDPALSGTLLVALTGWGSEDDRRQTLEAGFDVHLTKPVDLDTVQALFDEPGRLQAGGRVSPAQ